MSTSSKVSPQGGAKRPERYFSIKPPLINSSNPWATTKTDLLSLYNCPHTGAVTTRTSLWRAFTQHPSTHQYTFFSSSLGHSTSNIDTENYGEGRGEVVRPRASPNGVYSVAHEETSSLNTLGYSPITFTEYIETLVRFSQEGDLQPTLLARGGEPKPFIVSVTGTPQEIGRYYWHLLLVQSSPDTMYPHPEGKKSDGSLVMLMEINLSCPNILDKPPPAYDAKALGEYIEAIVAIRKQAYQTIYSQYEFEVHIGIKLPPFTYAGQFEMVFNLLESSSNPSSVGCPISFITATNTLGSCYVLNASNESSISSVNGSGIGGMAGEGIHFLSLGNVKTISEMLEKSKNEELKKMVVIGIGGVRDNDGFKRMRLVGADCVGVGTALGREGIAVFGSISEGFTKEDVSTA